MKTLKIVRKEKKKELDTVYDFTVDEAHHYLLENGVVSHNSYFPQKILSGGSGLIYTSDTIGMLSKKKDKDDKTKEVMGNIITVRMLKSRLSRENTDIDLKLSYTKGLDKYYGLFDLGVEAGVFVKEKTRWKCLGQDGLVFESEIERNPERFYTKPVLDEIEKVVKRKYQYGAGEEPSERIDPETGEVLE